MDLEYIEEWVHRGMDLKLLAKTVPAVVSWPRRVLTAGLALLADLQVSTYLRNVPAACTPASGRTR